MSLGKQKILSQGASAAPAPFDPLQNFETVTYTGNGGTQKITGYIRKGAGFNGSSSYITSGSLPTVGTGDFAFSCFFNQVSGTSQGALFSTTTQWFAANGSVSPKVLMVTDDTTTKKGDTAYTQGQFEHALFTRTSGVLKIFQNGSEVFSGAYTDSWDMSQFGIGVARAFGSRVYYFNGVIDQIRIFNTGITDSSKIAQLAAEDYTKATKSTTDIFGDGSGVALYELDESANDTGTNPYGTGAIDSGQSAVFNGSNSYIDLGNSAFQYTTFSISAWVYPTVSQNNTILENYESGGSPTNSGWFLRVQSDNTVLFGGYGSQAYGLYTTSTVPLNAWTNVTLTFSPSASAIYFNSVAQPTASSGWNASFGTIQYSTGGNNNGNPTSIGRLSYTGGAYNYFYGRIDEIRVYNDTLTAAEILDITKNDTSNIPTGNLQAHYKLDGNDNDSTGNTNGVSENSITYTSPATFPFIQYNGTATNINFLGMAFSPDLIWVKNRDRSVDHALFDSIRGATQVIRPNQTTADSAFSDSLTSFNNNGFSLGSDAQWWVNKSGDDYVAWCFKGANTTTSISASGSQLASEVRANVDGGFSIVRNTGTASYTDTIGHGLSQAPELVIQKPILSSVDWYVLFNISGTGAWDWAKLNEDDAFTVDNPQRFATSSTTINNWGWNGYDMINYCFHSVAGYQKVGTYSGGTSGYEVTLDFNPRFVMIKNTTTDNTGWVIVDSQRGSNELYPNLSNAEDTTTTNIILGTNKFTLNTTGSWYNASGTNNYLYLAIA